jgi:hypothetical protein
MPPVGRDVFYLNFYFFDIALEQQFFHPAKGRLFQPETEMMIAAGGFKTVERALVAQKERRSLYTQDDTGGKGKKQIPVSFLLYLFFARRPFLNFVHLLPPLDLFNNPVGA